MRPCPGENSARSPIGRGVRAAIRGIVITILFLLPGPAARAGGPTGRIFGRASDQVTGAALAGLTIVAKGPQGDEATLTDEHGDYDLAALPVGTYLLQIYAPGAAPVERPGVVVSAEKAVRVNLHLPRQQDRAETYVIERRAPMVDLGTARAGITLSKDDLVNVPGGTSFGDAIARTPRAFVDGSGSVSIAGASGLENVYLVDGLNVTGVEYGDILSPRPNSSGGSNLPIDFVEELSISSGGYAAEYGGAMGGVVNVVTKSGSNEFHGTAFSRLTPTGLQSDPLKIRRAQSALVGSVDPGTEWELGAEVGGPLVRNRLFFWVGFAPQRLGSTFVRDVEARSDTNGDGIDDRTPAGDLVTTQVAQARRDQSRTSYPLAAKLTFLPRPEQRLNLSLFSTSNTSEQAFDRTGADAAASADPSWAMQKTSKRNTDVNLTWTGNFLDRHWRLDGQIGLHDERYRDRSPDPNLSVINQHEWYGVGLFDQEGIAACRPVMRAAGNWDPCPADIYRNGGYGATRRYSAQRWVAELKSTHLFAAGGAHELKYGAHVELSVLDQTRYFSGPLGGRALVQHGHGNVGMLSFFSLPAGRYPFQFADGGPGDLDPNMDGSPAQLAEAPFYRDELQARVKNLAPALFIQDSYAVLPNLNLLLGARYEKQRLYDYQGQSFADLGNLGFRGGAVYDFSNEGRSKLFAHYGRFYEAVPLNMAVRYFGGEGILVRNSQDPPPYALFNNGSNYPVQPQLRGQFHDEIVAGAQYEVTPGSLLGLEYTRRWLGAIIEDGTAADGTFVLGNPGQIPDQALQAAQADVAAKEQEVAAAAPADRGARQAELGALQSRYENLKGLAAEPKPERTYNAITLSLAQRLGQRLALNAWYTYSRLWGNYNGLYDADNNYFAPNGGNAYDTPDLVLNKRGPLANDRPHAARLSGYYDQPLAGAGALLGGLSFAAFSGVPRNHTSALFPGQQLVFLLPRGSAGRTPTVTQLDAKLAYRHRLSKLATVELALELFNLLNQRTALREDDNYTYDPAAAIVGGSTADLPHAKNAAGAPVTPNSNFGRATVYQPPFHGRLSLRAMF